jgi:hypothetical protein
VSGESNTVGVLLARLLESGAVVHVDGHPVTSCGLADQLARILVDRRSPKEVDGLTSP